MKIIFKRFLMFPLIGILTCSFGNVLPKKPEPSILSSNNSPLLHCPPYSGIFLHCSSSNSINSLQIFKWEPSGENLVFNRMISNIDTTNYSCFMQSITKESASMGIDWCIGNFSLMYSFPVVGGYGKRKYIRLTAENFAVFKVAIIQKDAHLHWIPYRWFPTNAICQ